jgi:hypothetical protein
VAARSLFVAARSLFAAARSPFADARSRFADARSRLGVVGSPRVGAVEGLRWLNGDVTDVEKDFM